MTSQIVAALQIQRNFISFYQSGIFRACDFLPIWYTALHQIDMEQNMTSAAETKFTPGPWNAKVDDLVPERGAVYVEGPEGWDRQSICDCRYSDEGVERDEANARLIAAAPDLFEALELVVGSLKFDREDAVSREVMRRIDVALSKARGGV